MGNRGKNSEGHVNGFSQAPGHPRCKMPTVPGTMPPGWHWCRDEQRLVTASGVVVPIVDHPLVGTDEQRAATALRLKDRYLNVPARFEDLQQLRRKHSN
jgi:hypothetical protein